MMRFSIGDHVIQSFFEACIDGKASVQVNTAFAKRLKWDQPGIQILKDSFFDTGAECCFIRLSAGDAREVCFEVDSGYRLEGCQAGGWLVLSQVPNRPNYWIPRFPSLLSLDKDGHILSEERPRIIDMRASIEGLSVTFGMPKGLNFDLVVWRFLSDKSEFPVSLGKLCTIERQPIFLRGSHTRYERPADVYLHLIYGDLYENRRSWPKYWKICSEDDAHSLYVVLNGLECATGKLLYRLLKHQILLSVMARQHQDGGWYHGEWTDLMESHYRLHCSGMHLLMDAFLEERDEMVQRALEKAVVFIVGRRDKMEVGVWFLHDSLEHSPKTMDKGPFRWRGCGVLGKSQTNMLVLNTHLHTTIALDRYCKVTGDTRYKREIQSARKATRAVLALRPAEQLYRLLFWAIGLTFLPTSEARRLPWLLRAVKRVGWKYLIPWLPRIKAIFPRLVMPGGCIDRAQGLATRSFTYQSINLMDLLRYKRRFPLDDYSELLNEALRFTQESGIRSCWAEQKNKEYALGFWAEALYHLCTQTTEWRYRSWLAEAILNLEEKGIGLPPSLLGANREVVGPHEQVPCPSATDLNLRVANLSTAHEVDILVVNPTTKDIPLLWENETTPNVKWVNVDGGTSDNGTMVIIPARSWVWGRGASIAERIKSCISVL